VNLPFNYFRKCNPSLDTGQIAAWGFEKVGIPINIPSIVLMNNEIFEKLLVYYVVLSFCFFMQQVPMRTIDANWDATGLYRYALIL
jgi:hypothetical protein